MKAFKVRLVLAATAIMVGATVPAACGDKKSGELPVASGENLQPGNGSEEAEKASEDQNASEVQNASEADRPSEVNTNSEESDADTAKTVVLSKELTQFQKDTFDGANPLGVIFLGWSGNYSQVTLKDLLDENKILYSPVYPYAMEMDGYKVVEQPGEEVYLLVPLSEEYKITVYEQVWQADADAPERGKLLYEAASGEPILIKGNQSEIYSNFEILVDGKGEAFLFHPQLSMRDSSVAVETGARDFTIYAEGSREEEFDLPLEQAAYEKLRNTPEIEELLDQGMVMYYEEETVTINDRECMLFVLGTDHEEQFVRELYYAVTYDGTIFKYDPIADLWTEFSF